MLTSMDALVEMYFASRDPQFYVGEDEEDPNDIISELEMFEIEEEDPESLAEYRKEAIKLLKRCRDAGIEENEYEFFWPVLDRLGIAY